MNSFQPTDVRLVDSYADPAPQPNGGRRFPEGFLFGAATAAYQIEGAAATDGRTPSIWDTFSERPGAVVGGHTGHVAVDHYHRYRDDVALMKRMGLDAYRFSVSWSRVQPAGAGPANPAGLDFYRRLVDELLQQGIEPWLTLYHWDLPQPIEDAGGWPARDTPSIRGVRSAGARGWGTGRQFTTLNEPKIAFRVRFGEHAPGRRDLPPPSAVHHPAGHGPSTRSERSGRHPDRRDVGNLYAVSPASSRPRISRRWAHDGP